MTALELYSGPDGVWHLRRVGSKEPLCVERGAITELKLDDDRTRELAVCFVCAAMGGFRFTQSDQP